MKKEVKDKKKKVSIWKYVKKCYPYFKREKKALIILIIISLIISIFNSFGPALMAKVLDYATSSRLDAALKYLLFVVGLALVIDFFDKIVFIRNYTKIQESITNNIKIHCNYPFIIVPLRNLRGTILFLIIRCSKIKDLILLIISKIKLRLITK